MRTFSVTAIQCPIRFGEGVTIGAEQPQIFGTIVGDVSVNMVNSQWNSERQRMPFCPATLGTTLTACFHDPTTYGSGNRVETPNITVFFTC